MAGANTHLQVAVVEMSERIDQVERELAERIKALEATVGQLLARGAAPAVAPVRPIGEARPLNFVKWAKPCRICGATVPVGPANPPAWYDPADKSLTCATCPHPAAKAA